MSDKKKRRLLVSMLLFAQQKYSNANIQYSEELSCLKEFGKNDADAHFGVNEIAPLELCGTPVMPNLCVGRALLRISRLAGEIFGQKVRIFWC